MVWMEAESVSTLPSSTTTLPEREIILLGVRSGGGSRGTVAEFGFRPLPPREPVCAGEGKKEMEITKARARRVFMEGPQEQICPRLYPGNGRFNCQSIVSGGYEFGHSQGFDSPDPTAYN